MALGVLLGGVRFLPAEVKFLQNLIERGYNRSQVRSEFSRVLGRGLPNASFAAGRAFYDSSNKALIRQNQAARRTGIDTPALPFQVTPRAQKGQVTGKIIYTPSGLEQGGFKEVYHYTLNVENIHDSSELQKLIGDISNRLSSRYQALNFDTYEIDGITAFQLETSVD